MFNEGNMSTFDGLRQALNAYITCDPRSPAKIVLATTVINIIADLERQLDEAQKLVNPE